MMPSNGRTNNKIAGIVSRRDIDYIYVWSLRYPLHEFKFPRYGPLYGAHIPVCGDVLKFDAPTNMDAVQDVGSVERYTPDYIKVIHPNGNLLNYAVRAHLSFPPAGEDFYARELEIMKPFGVRAIAHSMEFGKVALLSDNIGFEPLKLYEGYVTRIPVEKDWIAKRIGTLFIISEAVPLKELRESPNLVEVIRQCMPWKDFFASPRQPSRNALDMFESISNHQQLRQSVGSSTSDGNSYLWMEDDDGNHHHRIGEQNGGVHLLSSSPILTNNNTPQSAGGNVPQNGLVSSPSAAVGMQPRMVDNDAAIRALADKENELFAQLVVCKLKSVYRHSSSAGICLQRQLLDVCNRYALSFLTNGGNQQQEDNGQ